MARWKGQNIKRMDNNCHIPDLVQAFSYVENGGLNMVLMLVKLPTCMTVPSNSIIFAEMCEQINRHKRWKFLLNEKLSTQECIFNTMLYYFVAENCSISDM